MLIRLRLLFFIGFLIAFISCSKQQINTAVTSSKTSALDSTSVVWPASFGFGRIAHAEEIAVLDIDVRPDGTGLPEGVGISLTGKLIYKEKCAACHGKTGMEGTVGGKLVSPPLDTLNKTIGNYWPYSTTLFDYIRRAMPFNKPGSLTDEEVYHLTAYLLSANRIVDSTTVITKKTLPEIIMPARHLFIPDDRNGGPEIR